MNFRTEIKPLQHSGLISHHDNILMLGSCFTDNIGAKLRQHLFSVCANPFGTLYNPASINAAIERISSLERFSSSQIHLNADNRWFSYDCHTKLNNPDDNLLLDSLNTRLTQAHEFLRHTSVACITLGTAWVFRLKSTGRVVANCQKQPSGLFSHELMSVEQCTHHIKSAVSLLRLHNPRLTVILTVSPIRHLANGAHGNQISKSTLLLACEAASQSLDNLIYFPSYEIMMDDLRSYRFYAADMKHPSDTAIEYIYSIFAQSFFNNDTIELSQQALRLMHKLAHRPIYSSPEAEQKTLSENQTLVNAFVQRHPELQTALQQALTNCPINITLQS